MSSVQEFNCLFCQDSFSSKEDLQVHFRKHGDPKFNQNTKAKSQVDMAASGDKTDEGEVVKCDVCEEVFPTISKAITHKHKMHPDHDTKYFCPWCGKLFTMKHLYNKHIKSTHDSSDQSGGTGFHCDYCEVDFFLPSAMIYHNKFFHRQDTVLAAIGHSKKIKMCNQEPLQIYYCPFCGEEYYNKVNLHKHMGDDHIDENQTPEDVLRCPLCEAVFYHLDAYELHLTFHSLDDQYTEENELIKGITEFSLETVPPMMEKVENESQDDEPAESIGIEELLQQGMNESNDTTEEPRKKKKHKKHKKSKKTITLDEFLNMHSDVLGEDLDIQGIVEVPTQVVTKQLRKPQPQKLKPGAKGVPSAELAKLRKAGIVVKKKPVSFQGMKILNKKQIVNSAQTGKTLPIQSKSKLPLETKDGKSPSSKIISKLLNQSNSQIRIVKKTVDSNLETDTASAGDEFQNEDIVKVKNDNIERNEDNNTDIAKEKNNEHDNEDKINNCSNDDFQTDICPTHDTSSQESHKLCLTIDNSSNEQVTKTKCATKSLLEDVDEQKSLNPTEIVQLPVDNVAKPTKRGETINALKNISQHITVKSVPSTHGSQIEEKDPVSEITVSNDENVQENNKINNVSTKEDSCKGTNKHPLNALKHLSHLTVKSAKQSMITTSPVAHTDNIDKKATNNAEHSKNTDIDEEKLENESLNVNSSSSIDTKDAKITPNFDALKNLSKHITVKSMNQSPNNTLPSQNSNRADEIEDNEHADINVNKSNKRTENNQTIMNKQTAIKNIDKLKSSGTKLSSPNHSPKMQKMQPDSEVHNKGNEIVLYSAKSPANADILKRLSNLTAKPINVAKNFTQKVAVQKSTVSPNVQKDDISQISVKKSETKQKDDIEIFNIEDSDDEDITLQDLAKNQQSNKSTNSTKKVETTKIQEKSMEVLKNLSKHITIKSKHQPNQSKQEHLEEYDEMLENGLCPEDFDSENGNSLPQKSLENQIDTILQNKLKNLGSITMKSRNSSPKNIASTHSSPNLKNSPQLEEFDSDPENFSKVKITELPDDYPSDEDIPLQKIKQTHNETFSEEDNDNEDYNEAQVEDFDDIESQITPIKLKKPVPNINKTPNCLNNLKNITVKSLKESDTNQGDENITENVYNDGSVDNNQESATKLARQQLPRAIDQNSSTSSNQVNTFNKEVTVRTFQTKTVIEEITTTVTKTIRTVNQTTKQEAQNTTQKILSSAVRPQRMQSIQPNQKIQNFQGMSVRQATPVRMRMRNPAMPTRPRGANIRPSNQLVPVRPGVNVARLSKPRMSVAKQSPSPSTSSVHKPVIGKPLKISPNAMSHATKRTAPEEPTGHFSCFKKPKESLIPGSPNFTDIEGDSAVQYASSSHVSRSNFSSITKTMKGNSLVSSTQTKSELCASTQQLNRLNSMSGLKVVKTSQMKQQSKVEEKVEMNTAKQNTLSAIEKLQKQGLLVKKPRIEEPEDSEHSNPPSDDDYYNT